MNDTWWAMVGVISMFGAFGLIVLWIKKKNCITEIISQRGVSKMSTATKKIMSLRLPENMFAQLETLADATGRTKSWLTTEALKEYLEREAWQISQIQAAIAEADAGDFMTDEEIAERDKKWGYNAN